MAEPATHTTLSREDYLEQSESSEHKAEWINGEIYAMSGARPIHNAVANRLAGAFDRRLLNSQCTPLSSDQRVYVQASDAFFYPDLTVVCGAMQLSPDDRMSTTNPTLIVEVLSPSTRDYDLGAKFEHYRLLDSLQHMLFVDPHLRSVTHLRRQEGGWFRLDLTEGTLAFGALDIEVPISEFFHNLDNIPVF